MAVAAARKLLPLCCLCHDRMSAVKGDAGTAVAVYQRGLSRPVVAHKCCAIQENRIFRLAYAAAAPLELQSEFVKSRVVANLSNATDGDCVIEYKGPFSIKIRCGTADAAVVTEVMRVLHIPFHEKTTNRYDTAVALAHRYVVATAKFDGAQEVHEINTSTGSIIHHAITQTRKKNTEMSLCWLYNQDVQGLPSKTLERLASHIKTNLEASGVQGIKSVVAHSPIRFERSGEGTIFSIGI